MLTRLNLPGIPGWLNEGLAELWGNTVIRGETVEMGYPIQNHLDRLRGRKLLPLEALFSVDRSSPYYTEKNMVSIFYAQSWALTHYLMIGDETGQAKTMLGKYLNLLQNDVDHQEALQQSFGDLKALEEKLESYVRKHQFVGLEMDASDRTVGSL